MHMPTISSTGEISHIPAKVLQLSKESLIPSLKDLDSSKKLVCIPKALTGEIVSDAPITDGPDL